MSNAASCYRRYRFPIEIISHAVWLYYRFCLSFRDVEDLLAERGKSAAHAQHFGGVLGDEGETTRDATPTIGPKSRINRQDNVSDRCDGSNPLVKRGGSCRYKVSFWISSASGDTG